jgi:molecular chaperone GrpE
MKASPTETDSPESEATPSAAASAQETSAEAAASVAAPESDAPPASEASSEATTELAAARAEAAAAKERHLRALADLENYRKRALREKDELRAYAAARVIEELLPVLDNLGLALTAAKAPNAELTALVGGIEMVANQFRGALEGQGLQVIAPAGVAFDPNLHEAMAQQPSAEVPEGQVLQVIRVGYSLNGRLLRPASVIVSGGPPPEPVPTVV